MDKKEIKSKVKDVLVEILDCFLGVPENIFRAFDRQEAYKIMRGNDNYNNILSVSNLSKLFFRLKRSGYIEITKSDTGESIRFTNKARLAVVFLFFLHKMQIKFIEKIFFAQ
ncbi:MAG: hypothetical protein NTW50_05175 [Candidatus Berkelbacteria bacterium]|nr:hypothetical protein [Candidatus Berkelbacteria bacterium]